MMMKTISVFVVLSLLVLPIFTSTIIASYPIKSDYESENSGLMDSPWPMFRHDVHHTGRSPYGKDGCTALLKWKVHIGGVFLAQPVIDKNGIIYTGSEQLYAIYPNGTIKWTLDISVWGVAIAKDGTIYVSTWGKNLYAVNPDGTIKWKCDLKDAACGDPLIGEDGTIYIGTSDPLVANGKFYAIYPNGTIKWSVKIDGCSSAVIHNNTIYTDCYRDGYLYAIYANNGTIKWKKWEGAFHTSFGPSVDEEGIIYYGSRNGYLYAFYPNGTLKWKYKIGGTYMPPVISENGTLYIASGSKVCAFDRNGTLMWKVRAYTANNLAIDKNGVIYGVGGHAVYALNPNGTLRWVWKSNEALLDGPAIGEDGTIYVVGENNLYAIEPRDAADLKISAIYLGPTFECIKIRVKNVGCEPAYNVTCEAKILVYPWEGDEETKIYTAEVPVIEVGQEVEVKIGKIRLSPLKYMPFHIILGPEIHLLKVEAENANHDLLWEGGGFLQMTIIGPLVCLGGLYYWLRDVMGDPHVHGFAGWKTIDP
ncbi:MAG: PQQ-like beta-propeller repeat protein [Thermoplasmata archaeon]|nr:MAG: PQQ-like beta-propeller repeat protein [Thermoplasmata archaeon]